MAKLTIRKLRKFASKLGPGLLTGAADNDPSGITTYSQTGAQFGSGLIWTIPFMLPLMFVVQEMSGRIGIVTGKGITAVLKEHYSKRFVVATAGMLFLANTINIGANIIGMAAAARLILPQLGIGSFIAIFVVLTLILEIAFKYKQYSRVLKFLTIALFAYMLTGFITIGNWGEILSATFIPNLSLKKEYLMMLTAVFGTTISPYLFFWQASLETEEGKIHHFGESRLKNMRIDTLVGMLFSQITAWFIIATSWAVLYSSGFGEIQTAADAAAALKPLVSGFPYANVIASGIFASGIVGLGLLSIPALATSASYAVSEVFGWREGISTNFKRAHGFYGTIALSTVAGLALYAFRITPIQSLILAAIINGLLAPILITFILIVCNNKKIMGENVNGLKSNLVGGFTVVAMLASAATFILLSV